MFLCRLNMLLKQNIVLVNIIPIHDKLANDLFLIMAHDFMKYDIYDSCDLLPFFFNFFL